MPALDIDGVQLAYEERGSGAPVLLIHGTGGAVWDPLPEQLAAAGHRAIYYHRRGFGDSTHEPIKDPPRHTRDAAALLERLEAVPAVVVGHSMGGVLTLDLVTSRPELVRGVVLVEPPFGFKKHPSMRMMRSLVGAQLMRRRAGDVAAAERFMRWATTVSDGTSGYDLTPPEQQEKLRANAPAIMLELQSGTGEHVKNAAIGKIGVPAVLLLGGSTLPEYGKAAQRLKRALPALEIVTVPGAGHVLPVTHPQAVVDAVARVSRDPALTA